MDGKAHAFEIIITGRKTTKEWIDKKNYLNSPLSFDSPKIFPEWMKYFHYAIKDARLMYDKKLRKKVEKVLREYEMTFWVDMDPKDWTKVTLYQKPDRQILTLAVTAWLSVSIVILIVCHTLAAIFRCLCCSSSKKEEKTKV